MLSNEQFRDFVIKQVEDVKIAINNFPEYQRLIRAENETLAKIEAAASVTVELSDNRATASCLREEFANIHCYMQGWRDALRSMLKE